MERVENRMVMDAWDFIKVVEPRGESTPNGYQSMQGDDFVSDEDAFEYAMNACMNGADKEAFRKEFEEVIVEWFFSGNWVRRHREC